MGGSPFENFLVNTVTDWTKFFSPQLFSPQVYQNLGQNPQFNINQNFDDLFIENDVLKNVGSYGMQLGVILEILNVLVSRLPKELEDKEQKSVYEFKKLYQDVNEAVEKAKTKQGNEDKISNENENIQLQKIYEEIQLLRKAIEER